MIKIYCNANIYNGLAQGRYPKHLTDKLRIAKENGAISVFWIPTNLFELVQGINTEDNFRTQQKAISEMASLSDNKVLEDPKMHVQKAVCRYLGLKEPISDYYYHDIARNIRNAPSLDAIRINLIQWQEYLNYFYTKRWVPQTEKLKLELLKIHRGEYVTPGGEVITVDKFVGAVTEETLWPAITERFEIVSLVVGVPHSEIIPKVLPILFYYSVCIGYYRKLAEGGRKPVSSDFVDIEQVVYLDTIDFFVYEDAKFKEVLNRSLFPELNRKCLNLEDFIEVLERN